MATRLRCPRCGSDNDAAVPRCPGCGHKLGPAPHTGPIARQTGPTDRICAACGARLPAGARACGDCGRPLERGMAAAASARTGIAAQARHAWRLTVVRGDGIPGPTYLLTRAATVCGRSGADAILPGDPALSPRHARLTLRERDVLLEDLGGTNGTFVRLRGPRLVGPGDEIRVGRQHLRIGRMARPAAGSARPWGSPDPGGHLRLVQLLEGGGTGEVFPLREGENEIGRESGDVTFPDDRFVSARHACLDVRGETATLVDASSSNGVYVRVTGPTPVGPGDELLLGMQILRLDA